MRKFKTEQKFVRANYQSDFIVQIQVCACAEKSIKNPSRGYEGQETLSFEESSLMLMTCRNRHIPGHIVLLELIKGNLHYLSHFSGKVLLKFCLVRHKTHSIVSLKRTNSKLSEHITFWVREFKAERKSVLREF